MQLALLYEFVDTKDPAKCWNWTRGKQSKGYGIAGIDGIQQLAHRVSYELSIGKIPLHKFVCHRCDNPACINPTHLFIGSQKDNMRDAKKKGRMVNPPPRAHSIVNEAMVRRIWKLRLSRNLPNSRIAAVLGCSLNIVKGVCTGRSWRHLRNAPTVQELRAVGRISPKIPPAMVSEIRAFMATGASERQAGEKFNISPAMAGLIKRNKRHAV